MRTLHSFEKKVASYCRKYRNKSNYKRLCNREFTILSNNCLAGFLYHNTGEKFLSPTINLYISPSDFVTFMEQLEYYLSLEVQEYKGHGLSYPVGMIGDIKIYFIHYKTFEEAHQKWEERKKRIKMDNLYVMMTDRITVTLEKPVACSSAIIRRFDALPYSHKVVFTSKEYRQFSSSYYLKEYRQDKVIGVITDYVNLLGKQGFEYSHFDPIAFLNDKSS